MAIYATFTGYTTVKNAYVKIGRIWGSKDEQWNAWVNVYKSPLDKEILTTFSVQTPYIDCENPYTLVYAAIANESFLSNVTHDNIVTEPLIKKKRAKS